MSHTETVAKRDERGKPLIHSPSRLKFRRIAAGLNITKAATASGYSKAHISMLEDGNHHSASPGCLKVLAETYGCKITDLIPDEGASAA